MTDAKLEAAKLALIEIARCFKIERPLISLDLETTGKVFGVDRIIQIGLLKIRPELEVTQWSTFVDPQLSIPAEATLKHKITNDMVAGAPTFGDLSPTLAAGLSGSDFIGYNLKSFDLKFLDAEFKRVGQPWSAEGARVIDPLRIWQVMSPRDLSAAVEEFLHEKHDDAHEALADVAGTTRALLAQLNRWPELPQSLDALHTLLYPRDPSWVDATGKIVWRSHDACIGFGAKWNGVALARVPKDYLAWMCRSDFPDDTKQIVRDAMNGKFPLKAAA